MRQVAAAGRPVEAEAKAPRTLSFPMTRRARASIGALAAVAMFLFGGVTLLVPSTWLTILGALEATLFTVVWTLTWTIGALAESLAFLRGAVRIGEALDLVLRTPQVTAVAAAASLAALFAVHLLHRLSSRPGGRGRVRGARAGALLLVGGLCFAGAAFGQPEGAGEASERAVDLDNRVAFGSTVRVGEDEVVNDVVSIGGDVKVDGEVRGNAVSVGGEAKINGRVTGEVVAVGGDVELGPEAEVFGDIVTVGGRLVREEGSSLLGEVTEVDWGEFDWNPGGDWFDGWNGNWFPRVGDRPPFFRIGQVFEFLQSIVFTFLLIALSGLILLVAPRGVDRLKSAAASDLWVMFAVGLGVEILFIPALLIACLLLFVTIIGIPVVFVLMFLAPFGLAAALVFGYAGAAAAAGDWCQSRFQGAARIAAGSFGALALGVLTIQALALVADLLGFLGLPWFFRAMFRLPGVLICYLAWTIGLGAVFMTRFGASDYGAAAAGTPVPPTPPPDDDGGNPTPPPKPPAE